jgi:GxxExxY protein
METSKERAHLDQITEKIIGCAYDVHRELKNGFLEKVYENALAYEIRDMGLKVKQQHPIQVKYKKIIAGDYAADLMVEELVLIELKAVESLHPVHMAQCLNYLRATKLKVCLIFNFGNPKLQFRRVVHQF